MAMCDWENIEDELHNFARVPLPVMATVLLAYTYCIILLAPALIVIMLSGGILCESELPEADIAILFIDTGGLGTMCGNSIIALARYSFTAVGSTHAFGVNSGLSGFLESGIKRWNKKLLA